MPPPGPPAAYESGTPAAQESGPVVYLPPPPGPGQPKQKSSGGGDGRRGWVVPLIAAGAGLVVGLGGAFGTHLVQNATMDSSLKSEQSARAAAVTGVNESLATAAKDFGTTAPDATVLDYLRALEAGKVDTKFEEGFVDKGVSTALLTTDAYTAVKSRLQAPTVVESHVNTAKGTAKVTVEYRVGAEKTPVTDDFALTQKDGKWVLDSSAVIVVPVTVDRSGTLSIAGTDITDDVTDKDGKMSGKVALLPGQYSAGFSESTGFWGAGDATVVVGSKADPAQFSLKTSVSKAVQDEVQAAAQAQANAWFDDCVASRLTADTCSGLVKEEGEYIKDKVVHRIFVQSYPVVSVTWNTGTNTFDYVGYGMVATEGAAVSGGTTTRPWPLAYKGTLTWHGPGNIEIPIGIV